MPEHDPFSLVDDDDDDFSPSTIELDKIPRRLWEQTLAPLSRHERYWIARQIADEHLQEIASNLAFELDMAEGKRRRERDESRLHARRTAAPLPTPQAGHAAARPAAQINIRLRRDDHVRLGEAASKAGMRPTTLARALVLNGVAMILREHLAGRRSSDGSPPNPGLSFRE
ncbi:MAG: hypothetical protein WKF48_11180 [Solirubrobacteraceae bacterium]